jgi:hypothetical protein
MNTPDPRLQFEACRALRKSDWSFFRIAGALGLTLSQVRVACDPRAAEAHERWRIGA